MKVRAKFRVDAITATVNGFSIELNAVQSGSVENQAFFKWTPNGKITMGVVEKATAEVFEVGKEYYVDFEKSA